MYKRFFVVPLTLVALGLAGCGGSSSGNSAGGNPTPTPTPTQAQGKIVVTATGPQVSASTAKALSKRLGKTVGAGLVITSWDGTKAAYGVPVYVEAKFTPDDPTANVAGIDVVISTDHPEYFPPVAVQTDADGIARKTMYAIKCADVETTVNVTAAAGETILATTPAVLTMMPSQLMLTNPVLGQTIKIHDYPVLGDDLPPVGDNFSIFLGGYEPNNGANIRFPFFSVARADGTPVPDGLAYTIDTAGLNTEKLQALDMGYGMMSPVNWPDLYPLPWEYYNATEGGKIPMFTQITSYHIPNAGDSVTLEIIWMVTITDPVAGPLVGYVAGTVQFANL